MKLKDLMDTIKMMNIYIIGSQMKKREKRAESVFKEIMAVNYPSLGKE